MRKITFAILFTLISTTSLFAQKNWVNGTVTLKDGTTKEIQIDDKEWSYNPKKIHIRNNTGVNEETLHVLDVTDFSVSGRKYFGAIVETSVSLSINIADYDQSPEPEIRQDTVFIEALILGEKSLFYAKNKKGVPNYYIKVNDRYVLLKHKLYKKKTAEYKKVVAENRVYASQLAEYLTGCFAIYESVSSLKYKAESLINLFKLYYKCTGTDNYNILEKSKKIKTNFGLKTGWMYANPNLNGVSFFENVNLSNSNSIVFGGSINFIFPKNEERIAIYNDLLYTNFSSKGEANSSVGKNNLELKLSQIKMSNLFRYSLYKKEEKSFYLNAGVVTSYNLSESNTRQAVDTFSKSVLQIVNTRALEIGFCGGIGVNHKKINVDLRYEYGGDLSSETKNSYKINRVYLLLGYTLQ